MRKVIVAFAILLFVPNGIAYADEEWSFEMYENGRIIILNPKYQPARYSKDDHTLTIGTKQVTFPECFVERFFSFGEQNISLSGHWEPTRLPPYISMSVSVPGRPYRFNLLFELDTLKIYWILITDDLDMGEFTYAASYPVELEESCKNEFHAAIRTVWRWSGLF